MLCRNMLYKLWMKHTGTSQKYLFYIWENSERFGKVFLLTMYNVHTNCSSICGTTLVLQISKHRTYIHFICNYTYIIVIHLSGVHIFMLLFICIHNYFYTMYDTLYTIPFSKVFDKIFKLQLP